MFSLGKAATKQAAAWRTLCDRKRAREAAASKSMGRDLTTLKLSIFHDELKRLALP